MFVSLPDSQTVKAIEQFGQVIEELLIKHGKKIIGECVHVRKKEKRDMKSVDMNSPAATDLMFLLKAASFWMLVVF